MGDGHKTQRPAQRAFPQSSAIFGIVAWGFEEVSREQLPFSVASMLGDFRTTPWAEMMRNCGTAPTCLPTPGPQLLSGGEASARKRKEPSSQEKTSSARSF